MDLSLIPSSSSNAPQFKYDVFLSFRGEDTRYGFTSHLHKALYDKGIITFIDYELRRGDEISPSLLKAIEESQISVVIFSKGYASSRWCLDELVKILECKNRETNKQVVIPVFYGVDPTEVRHQSGSFADAFVKHEERFKENLDKVNRWKDVLNEAANLSGWPSSTDKPESVLIEAIVLDVLMRLNVSSDTSDLVGIDSEIKKIKSWLCSSVRSVGIWGIGGIGKTTLAEAVFNNISCQFEASYFLYNIREQCDQSGGLNCMQRELLSAVLGNGNVNIGSFTVGRTFIKNILGRKKLLIVLDDVSNFRQLESLIGDFDCLNLQSRVIITTRDKQVLKNCKVDQVHELRELNRRDALKLFCKYAFRGIHPKVDFVELLDRVTRCAGGVPLALKILGSHLFDKGKKIWKSAMNKLEKMPHEDIHKVLKISFDGLDYEVQKIFLDIAFFFKGSDIRLAKSFLDACGFETEDGISVLIDKSLIDISCDTIITMHDLLLAMAREIVRQESTEDLGKRSRLWNHEEICRVLTKNMGTETIEGISLDMSNIRDIFLNPSVFANMHRLRFLEFKTSCYNEMRNKVHISQVLECDFSELRYLNWYACPLESLPSSFENLVRLEMRNSKLKQLWSGVLHLDKLQHLDLRFSDLTICPDFSGFPNLENLILSGCEYLCEISSSICYLNKLYIINLDSCKSLEGVPDCSALNSLRDFNLSDCSSLKMLPKMPYNIEKLNLASTAIEELPLSIKDLGRLVTLVLYDCKRLKSLPSSIFKWKSLETLNLNNCCKLDQLPIDIAALDSLRYLYANETGIRELPSSISALKNLKELDFDGTKVKDKVYWFLPHIVDWQNLTELNLCYCGIIKLPGNLGCCSSLKTLHLAGNSFESIPESIINLSRLECLDISNCERLKCLPKLQVAKAIDAYNCTSLNGLVSMDSEPLNGLYADFGNCFKLDGKILETVLQNAALKSHQVDNKWQVHEAIVHYPGSEIPDWFNFQQMGSSIKVELPLNSIEIGLLYCAVVALCPNPEDFGDWDIDWDWQPKSEDGYSHLRGMDGVGVSNFFHDCHYSHEHIFKSNHVFMLSHVPAISRPKTNEVKFSFRIGNLKIEKCGVHLISVKYTQQKEDRNNCLEEDEPHPKILKFFNFFSEHSSTDDQVHNNCEEEDEIQPEMLEFFNFFPEQHPTNQDD